MNPEWVVLREHAERENKPGRVMTIPVEQLLGLLDALESAGSEIVAVRESPDALAQERDNLRHRLGERVKLHEQHIADIAAVRAERDELRAEVLAYQLKDGGGLPGWAVLKGSLWSRSLPGHVRHLYASPGLESWLCSWSISSMPRLSGTAPTPRAAMRAAEQAACDLGWHV